MHLQLNTYVQGKVNAQTTVTSIMDAEYCKRSLQPDVYMQICSPFNFYAFAVQHACSRNRKRTDYNNIHHLSSDAEYCSTSLRKIVGVQRWSCNRGSFAKTVQSCSSPLVHACPGTTYIPQIEKDQIFQKLYRAVPTLADRNLHCTEVAIMSIT